MYLINLDLQIFSKNNKNIPNKQNFTIWINAFLSIFSLKRKINIGIIDILESKHLNFKYRGKNSATNILAFPFTNYPENKLAILGDLIICSELMEKEAHEQKKSIQAHWAHIVLHGCLHLIGYNHKYEYESKIMQTTEQIIMNYLGFPNPY